MKQNGAWKLEFIEAFYHITCCHKLRLNHSKKNYKHVATGSRCVPQSRGAFRCIIHHCHASPFQFVTSNQRLRMLNCCTDSGRTTEPSPSTWRWRSSCAAKGFMSSESSLQFPWWLGKPVVIGGSILLWVNSHLVSLLGELNQTMPGNEHRKYKQVPCHLWLNFHYFYWGSHG